MSLLTYPGGKVRHIEKFMQLLSKFPKRNVILSPFMGGGSFEIYLAKKGWTVYASDHNYHIVNFYKSLQLDKHKLAKYIKMLYPVTRPKFYQYLHFTREIHSKSTIDLQLAALFFVINKTSFNGMCRSISNRNVDTFNRGIDRILEDIKTFEFPSTLHIYCKDYRYLLNKYPNEIAFMDPPYHVSNTYYGFKGNKEMFDHKELATSLNRRKAPWIVTYNDTSYIRKLFSQDYIKKLRPTTGFMNAKGANPKGYDQLIITNFPQ